MIRWISLYDLLSFPESSDIVHNSDFIAFYQLMHDIGFDINEEIEYQDLYVRALVDNSIQLGRFVGIERKDDEWRDGGYCTFENRLEIAGKKDLSLQRELMKMSIESNFTGQLQQYLEDYWGGSSPGKLIEVVA